MSRVAGTGSPEAGRRTVRVRLRSSRRAASRGWAAYPAGVAWALREAGHRPWPGAPVAVDSDAAAGRRAVLVGRAGVRRAVALTEVQRLRLTASGLAALASRAENDFVGAPTGIMDQSASLLLPGRAGAAARLPQRRDRARYRWIRRRRACAAGDRHQARHRHAGGEYAARRPPARRRPPSSASGCCAM